MFASHSASINYFLGNQLGRKDCFVQMRTDGLACLRVKVNSFLFLYLGGGGA